MCNIILGAVIGAIFAAVITIIVEYLRRPNLHLNIPKPEEIKPKGGPADFIKSLRIKVENKPLPCWAKWMSRNPALRCRGYISFYHLDGQDVFGHSMDVRWPKLPQPLPLMFELDDKKGRIYDFARYTIEQEVDVFPGKDEFVDVACRFDKDKECYGWNTESYFSDPLWRNPKWQLSNDCYLVKVTILSSGQECNELFRLINDVSIDKFRLEKALPEDYDIIKRTIR